MEWRQGEQLVTAQWTNGREGKFQTEQWKWGEKVYIESRKESGKALRSVPHFQLPRDPVPRKM